MADHVAVGEVDAAHGVLAGAQQLDGGLGDLPGLHLGGGVEFDIVGRDLDVGLECFVDVAASVAVPEKGDMAELLGLADRKALESGGAEVLTERVVDRRWCDQVVGRHQQVAVVLEHAGEEEVGVAAPIEVVEVRVLVRLTDLNRTVAAEVEEHDGVAVGHGADRVALTVDDDEPVKVLVAVVRLGVHRLDGLARRRKRAPFAVGVAPIAALDHRPVGFVAVHRDRHTTTAGSDGDIGTGGVEFGDDRFGLLEIGQRRSRVDIASVVEEVEPDSLDALGHGLPHQGVEVRVVAVHVAVGVEAEQVQCRRAGPGDDRLPHIGVENGARLDGLIHELGALGEDPARTEGVVADFAVAHVVP